MRSFYYSFYRINSQFNDFLAQKIQKEEKSAMRNLKKILALALALVMSMSLMATANAFTDDDSITDTYETAVTVLSGLKVFQGYDDGSFLPQGAITRAEVAAIIYRIVTGDVADTQVGIYADYNKFDDVASTSWYAGYVNFCANAEYIKGYDARTFGPNDPVTGYQALAMILRALGYDKNGEFTGTNWTIQTAAVGEQRGITKNITAGTLGVPATREVVAEILFRAILVPKATYTPAFGYQTSVNGVENTSIGWDTFELEDITGVVVANEYADLYSASPMDEGETELDVDGESYTLAYATTVEDLGEARHAYVTGETVLAIADAGNTVWTNEGAETDIATSSKCEDVAGLERDDTTEEYINFANETYEYVTDIRISYWVDRDNDEVVDDDETGMFRKDHKLTTDEVEILEGIFRDDDKMDGWVVVGTKELSEPNDISDDITWREFCREYFQDTDALIEEVNGADNGEWLKVIDNDGDGVADYIFRIDFAMSVIERISKDNEYTLASLDDNDDEVSFQDTKIDGGDIATEDELAEGDVVLYTYIDGVYYMSIAEMVTETVDARGINSKTETMTCNGTDYVQSHIGYTDESEYYYDVTDAHTEVTYDLYLDHFGYVRLFIESDYNTFMLLTDASYEDDRRVETFQAMFWNVDADEEQQIDVADAEDVEAFISTDATGDQETWNRLYGADVTYFFSNFANGSNVNYITNISGYAETDDGYALKTVGNSTSRVDYFVRELQDDADQELDDCLDEKTLDGTAYRRVAGNVNATDVRIQTTTDTQYYLVIKDNDTRNRNELFVSDVITWTGYANTPDEAMLEDAVGYAVTHDGNGAYEVADVVVFEIEPYNNHNTYFVYEYNNWDVNHPLRVEQVWGIGYGENGEIADQRIDVEADDAWVRIANRVKFYEIYDDETVEVITGNYASHDIYAGEVTTTYDVSGRDYIRVAGTKNSDGELYIYPETATIYELSMTVDNAGNIEYDVAPVNRWDLIDNNEPMILFTDGDDNVEYAIAVGQSLYDYDDDGDLEYEGLGQAGDEMIVALTDLYQDITGDVVLTTLEQSIAAANAAQYIENEGDTARNNAWVTWDTAVARYNALKDLIDTASMTAAERTEATTALDNLAIRMMYVAQTDAKAEIQAEYDALAPSYSNNIDKLDAAKADADAEVEDWTIATVLDGYLADIPAIDVSGIDNDTVAMDNARQAALADIEDAKTAAMTLDKDYADGRLNSAITLAYDAAVKAVNEAATVAAVEEAAETVVTAIEATVVDAQNIADAVEYITTYASGYGPDGVAGLLAAQGIDVTVSGEAWGDTHGNNTNGDGCYDFKADFTSGNITYHCEWDWAGNPTT